MCALVMRILFSLFEYGQISFANREGRNDSAEASRQANAANERNKGLSAREIAARNYAEGNDPEDPGSIIDDDFLEIFLARSITDPFRSSTGT